MIKQAFLPLDGSAVDLNVHPQRDAALEYMCTEAFAPELQQEVLLALAARPAFARCLRCCKPTCKAQWVVSEAAEEQLPQGDVQACPACESGCRAQGHSTASSATSASLFTQCWTRL